MYFQTCRQTMSLLSLRPLRQFGLTAQTQRSHVLFSSATNSTQSSNHYEVLRITRNAKPVHIKEAYIQLCKEFHPDVNIDPEAATKFRLL